MGEMIMIAQLALALAATIAVSSPAQASAANRGPALSATGIAAPGQDATASAERGQAVSSAKKKRLAIVLFPGFETLDVFGPVEMWGRLLDYEVVMVSEKGGLVRSAQGVDTNATYSFADAPQFDILMIPGGGGTRREVNNPVMLDFLRRQDRGTEYTTSVCTGAAVLAKAGLLAGHKATTNKRAWVWATSQDAKVAWQPSARWVVDGKYVTSSGVSAGTDMALGLVQRLYGREQAMQIAEGAEYVWNDVAENDPFAVDVAGRPVRQTAKP
jgi:putative intracellular protease/amidase